MYTTDNKIERTPKLGQKTLNGNMQELRVTVTTSRRNHKIAQSGAKFDTMVLLSWFQSTNYSRYLNYNSYNVISKHVKKNNL